MYIGVGFFFNQLGGLDRGSTFLPSIIVPEQKILKLP